MSEILVPVGSAGARFIIFNPSVPKAHNSECLIQPVNVS